MRLVSASKRRRAADVYSEVPREEDDDSNREHCGGLSGTVDMPNGIDVGEVRLEEQGDLVSSYADACTALLQGSRERLAGTGSVDDLRLPPTPHKDFLQKCCCTGGPELPENLEDGRRVV